MKKFLFTLAGVIILLPFLADLILTISIENEWQLSLFEDHAGIIRTVKDVFLSLLAFCLALFMLLSFWVDGISKHRLSDVFGIIGLTISLLCLAAIKLWPTAVWLLLVSAFLSAFCFIRPCVDYVKENVKASEWEKGVLIAIAMYFFIYWVGYNANIKLSLMFGVDPKHFDYTKPLAGVVFLAPYLVIAFFCLVVLLGFRLFLKKNDGANTELEFYELNGLFASVSLLIFSFAFTLGSDSLLERFASVVDFNPSNVCRGLSKEVDGVIYLDPGYSLVLVYNSAAKSKDSKYVVTSCNTTK
ncbi:MULTISPECIES: hypothetical protein [Vibrionaceae]|uniref:hypothetical protein n=1 Tax=Vibrionaceae TaxID=641 RepID=UPI001303E12B|nr:MULTISPECIES: hypothetical protein [Vibrionaceae]EJE4188983.1 hypothetical protein [Vibrio parahaemolyticus]ELP9501509.1 hypothetical protein [Vibrio alginolyticus]MBE3710032.1 hypothetical protein [Vibrio parahaemolyticus]